MSARPRVRHRDAQLLALCAEFQRLNDYQNWSDALPINGPDNPSEERLSANCRDWWAVAGKIADCRARTDDGLRHKAAVGFIVLRYMNRDGIDRPWREAVDGSVRIALEALLDAAPQEMRGKLDGLPLAGTAPTAMQIAAGPTP